MGGAAEAALPLLAEAQQRFQTLAEAGDASASRMVSGAIMDHGDCLTELGRLERRRRVEEAIERA